jgi:hypothetical protein
MYGSLWVCVGICGFVNGNCGLMLGLHTQMSD